MKQFKQLSKLRKGDKVAILSPSFAAPARWPHVYEFGLSRIRSDFGLVPVEYPTTKKLNASKEERMKDLIDAFTDPEIKAVITTLGGDDQVTYVKNLPKEPFANNPKPFFGYSDNSHFINHLWLCGVPAYYGGCVFTEYAMQGRMDDLTVKYLNHALFEGGTFELNSSDKYNDIDLGWDDPSRLFEFRKYESNEGWYWDGGESTTGITWGGCIESIDEMLRHGVEIPTNEDFENVILIAETAEDIPSSDYVWRVFRALGERGILSKVKGLLIGRPKAWEFDKMNSAEEKSLYKSEQRKVIIETFRMYNQKAPVVQNLDFGHTAPQICMPIGSSVTIDSAGKKIIAEF